MRFVISSIAVFALVAMAAGAPVNSDSSAKPLYKLEEFPALFEKFIKDYNREYKDEADKQLHYEAFVKSLNSINKLNSDPKQSATFGINNLADKTEDEQKWLHGVLKN